MAKALWTSIKIKLVFCFLGQNEFQGMCSPVKVDFLYTDVIKQRSLFSLVRPERVRNYYSLFQKSNEASSEGSLNERETYCILCFYKQ